jgi:hypothetical protein
MTDACAVSSMTLSMALTPWTSNRNTSGRGAPTNETEDDEALLPPINTPSSAAPLAAIPRARARVATNEANRLRVLLLRRQVA